MNPNFVLSRLAPSEQREVMVMAFEWKEMAMEMA
jgi:hypothetical protein